MQAKMSNEQGKSLTAAAAAEVEEKTEAVPPPAKKFRYTQGQQESTESLYLNAELKDVNFVFGSDDNNTTVRVPAHKCILAGASDVFKAMFYGDLKESGDVCVVDASDTVFREFLQFFYLTEVDLTAENIAGVLNLGHKYNVKKCIDGCSQFLINTLSNENVCMVLALAIHYNNDQQQQQLIKVCERRILNNTAAVFKSANFLECDKKVLTFILEMQQLSCSEVDIFEACMAWVQFKSKQNTLSKKIVKKYLGDLYYNIRYTSMTYQEFCALEIKYESVLSSDFKTIMRLIAQPRLHSDHFNTSPRRIQWNGGAIVKCDRETTASTGRRFELLPEERTTFLANQLLLLGNIN